LLSFVVLWFALFLTQFTVHLTPLEFEHDLVHLVLLVQFLVRFLVCFEVKLHLIAVKVRICGQGVAISLLEHLHDFVVDIELWLDAVDSCLSADLLGDCVFFHRLTTVEFLVFVLNGIESVSPYISFCALLLQLIHDFSDKCKAVDYHENARKWVDEKPVANDVVFRPVVGEECPVGNEGEDWYHDEFDVHR